MLTPTALAGAIPAAQSSGEMAEDSQYKAPRSLGPPFLFLLSPPSLVIESLPRIEQPLMDSPDISAPLSSQLEPEPRSSPHLI
jgi:hypothetical protein